MQGGFFSTPHTKILGAVLILMVIIALGSYASVNFERLQFLNPQPPSISVTGEGEVVAVPDVGQFSFSVTAEGADAAAVQESSATKINAVLGYLEEQGIAESDIKTQGYTLSPKYHWEQDVCIGSGYCPGRQVQDGFTVTQSVLVKVRDLDLAGQVIAGVGGRGATNISGLAFTIDDPEALRAEAREQAIADARTKASALAAQLGVRVVRLSSYYEDGGDLYEPYYERTVAADAFVGGGIAPELPVGEQSTTVRVHITYEVR